MQRCLGICLVFFEVFFVINEACKGPDLVKISEVPKIMQEGIRICLGTLIGHSGIIKTPKNTFEKLRD